MPLKSLTTRQEVASSTEELQESYNRLYQDWLGDYHNVALYGDMLDQMQVKAGKLLDVACGLGDLLDMAVKRGSVPYGIDISSVALQKGKIKKPTYRMVEGNGEHLPWASNTFDYITCVGSLEHFINPDIGAQEIARVLKPSGLAAINLPNSHHLQAIYNIYKTGSILPELQDFERFATRHEWQGLLEENGLRVKAVYKFNTGFSRIFKEGREPFWYFYNAMFKLFGDRWIPTNLSFGLTFVCAKAEAAA